MMNSKHVPKRRFKEFELDGDWEFSRFGEAVVRVSESMKNSSFPNVEYEDVIPGRGKLNKNIFEKTNNKKGIRFLEGDVLYGKLRPYLKNWLLSDFKGIAVGDWWVLRSSGLDSKFLYNFIQTEKYQVVANRSTGTKMPRSDWETVKDSDIFFPSIFEQKQIGNFFQTIDSLITLHQHKLDKLKNLKRAYLSEMFPAEGERVPKRRFPGFEGEWERQKWIDTVNISTEMVDPSLGEFDNMLHIAPGNIESFTGRILGNVKTVKEEHLISGKFRFRPGDIVYGKINPQLGKYFFAKIDGLTSADAYVLNGINGTKQEFLYTILQSKDFFNYSVSVSKRSGMPKINREELNDYSYWRPGEVEQKKIGELFQIIESLQFLQQQKLDKLNDLKKAYLNELFV